MHPSLIPRFASAGAFLALANICSSLALSTVGVTLTYVARSTVPVWICLWCCLVQRQPPPSRAILLHLGLVCCGVMLASASDVHFRWDGLGWALCSCVAHCFFTILSKESMKGRDSDCSKHNEDSPKDAVSKVRKKVSPTQAFAASAWVASLAAVPMYYTAVTAHEISQMSQSKSSSTGIFSSTFFASSSITNTNIIPPTNLNPTAQQSLFLHVGLSYFAEYAIGFAYIAQVEPVTYALTDTLRRLVQICVNALVFRKPLTGLNCVGVLLALGGALGYAVEKGRQNAENAGVVDAGKGVDFVKKKK